MQKKLCLVVLVALVGLVVLTAAAEDPEAVGEKLRYALLDAAESLSYSDYNSVMWLHRILSERDRWSHWRLPQGVDDDEADFVRGLTAYGSSIFHSEIMHHWSYGTELDSTTKEEEYAYRFSQRIVQPCEEMNRALGEAFEKIRQSELHGFPVKLDEFSQAWMDNEKSCNRLLEDPKHWIELSYKVSSTVVERVEEVQNNNSNTFPFLNQPRASWS